MKVRLLCLLATLSLLAAAQAPAQEMISFEDSWGPQGFQVLSQTRGGLEINFSIPYIQVGDLNLDQGTMKKVSMPGALLGNDEGAPDLPGIGRFIAFPQGAAVTVSITGSRTHRIEGIDLAPAPNIPAENDDAPRDT